MRLADIARDMERQAARSGCAQRELPRGLSLELVVRKDAERRLRLSRPVVPPSSKEEQICREAFGVPAASGRVALGNLITLWWEP